MSGQRWAQSVGQGGRAARLHTPYANCRNGSARGGRPKAAAYYPPDLIVEILRGMRDEADAKLAEDEAEEAQALIASIQQSNFNLYQMRLIASFLTCASFEWIQMLLISSIS